MQLLEQFVAPLCDALQRVSPASPSADLLQKLTFPRAPQVRLAFQRLSVTFDIHIAGREEEVSVLLPTLLR